MGKKKKRLQEPTAHSWLSWQPHGTGKPAQHGGHRVGSELSHYGFEAPGGDQGGRSELRTTAHFCLPPLTGSSPPPRPTPCVSRWPEHLPFCFCALILNIFLFTSFMYLKCRERDTSIGSLPPYRPANSWQWTTPNPGLSLKPKPRLAYGWQGPSQSAYHSLPISRCASARSWYQGWS